MSFTSDEAWENHFDSLSPARKRYHYTVLSALLFDPEVELCELEMIKADAMKAVARQARRDRLLLNDALKKEHEQELTEEIAVIEKRVEEMQVWVQNEIASLKPVALQKVVSEYEHAMEHFYLHGDTNTKGRKHSFLLFDNEAEEFEEIGSEKMDTYDSEENELDGRDSALAGVDVSERETDMTDYTLSSLNPLSTKRLASPMTTSESNGDFLPPLRKKNTRSSTLGNLKQRVVEDLVDVMVGAPDRGGRRSRLGLEPEGLVQEVIGSLNQAMLQKQLSTALAAAKQECEQERHRALNDEMEKRLKTALEQMQCEMSAEFENHLQEEKEKVRVLTEVAMDEQRRELEERLKEEHAREMAEVLQKVGLA